jgi:hypothetical protein
VLTSRDGSLDEHGKYEENIKYKEITDSFITPSMHNTQDDKIYTQQEPVSAF